MKMETAKVEYEIFDCADVITTSGGGDPIPTTLDMIWLPASSITNYNAVYPTTDDDLLFGFFGTNKAYYGFSGGSYTDEGQYFAIKGTNDTPEEQYIYRVSSSTDKDGYNRILNWLQGKQ